MASILVLAEYYGGCWEVVEQAVHTPVAVQLQSQDYTVLGRFVERLR